MGIAQFKSYIGKAHYAKAIAEVKQAERKFLADYAATGKKIINQSINNDFSQVGSNGKIIGWGHHNNGNFSVRESYGKQVLWVRQVPSTIGYSWVNWYFPSNFVGLKFVSPRYRAFLVARRIKSPGRFQLGMGYDAVFDKALSDTFQSYEIDVSCNKSKFPKDDCIERGYQNHPTFAPANGGDVEIAYLAIYQIEK